MKQFIFKIWFLIPSFIFGQKVLFVGNSFTFYWNLPAMVESMAEQKGIKMDIFQSTAGSATLEDHWEGKRDLESVSNIKHGKYDFVILQDHSTYPLENTQISEEYFQKFIELIKSTKAEPVIYSTWMYPGISDQSYNILDPINYNLSSMASLNGVRLAPVGRVFRFFKEANPDISLHTSDDKHPSPVGTYLAACVFFKLLTGESPKGLSRRYVRKDGNGKKIFLGMVETSDAIKCQNIVDSVDIK